MDNYSKADYWDDRYDKEKLPYEWLQGYYPNGTYTPIRDLFDDILRPDMNILIVGIGSSMMGQQMYEDGYKYITCTDRSPFAIKF